MSKSFLSNPTGSNTNIWGNIPGFQKVNKMCFSKQLNLIKTNEDLWLQGTNRKEVENNARICFDTV